MSKKVNTDPIDVLNIKTIFYKFFKKYGVRSTLFLISLCIFFIYYNLTNKILSNDYILNSILNSSYYSQRCSYLNKSDPELINKLKFFYSSIEKNPISYNIIFTNMSTTLFSNADVKDRKSIYIEILLPILLKVVKEIQQDRDKIIDIHYRMVRESLIEEDFELIEDLSKKYKVDLKGDVFWYYDSAVDDLLLKVDVIPNSLALAISIIETGWGVSRFLEEGNALFAEWAWRDDRGIIPFLRGEEENHVVRKFSSLEESIRSFYFNLNIHPEYHKFRIARREARKNDKMLDSTELSQQLDKYSTTIGYTSLLNDIIESNDLKKFDNYININSNKKEICITFF